MKSVLATLLFCMLIACNPFSSSVGPVSKALREEVREKRSVEIDLKNTVPFVWDELHLFNEYRPRADICKELKLTDVPCSRHVSVESVAEGEMFLVFRHKGAIVHTEMHSVFNGDFTPLDYPQPITPERARFIVKEDGKFVNGEPLFRLRPKS